MKDALFYIWLQQALGLYSRNVKDIFAQFESITDVYNCDDFSFLGEKRDKYIKRLENKDTSAAFEVLKRCEAMGVNITGYYDELYPKGLKNIDAPPAALYSIGILKDLNNIPCIAIVGTRDMSERGKTTAEKLAYTFAKSGACVVSGLAKGIDTAAHRGAIMADGFTVGVLGNPIGDIYPKENIKAFETLYKRGLVISELYPGAPRTRADFPNRNRIISGLCSAVVIAEAGEKSGALITARHGIAQGRSVFAVPAEIGSEAVGTNALIKQGIPPLLDPNDVLNVLSLGYPDGCEVYEPAVTEQLRSYGNKSKSKEAKPKQTPKHEQKQSRIHEIAPETISEITVEAIGETEERFAGASSERILAVLRGVKPLSIDEIVHLTGIPVSEVMAELTLMEIDGSVISAVGGRYISAQFN